jgi:hypothetical protein
MREKQYRKKWLTKVKEAKVAAVESAQSELRNADTRGVKANATQAKAIDKARTTLNQTKSPKTVAGALHAVRMATLFDRDQPIDARKATLQIGMLPIGESKSVTLRVLKLIGDPKQPEELRLAALQNFRAATFAMRSTAEWRPTYLETLREIVRKERNAVADRALHTLAQEKDGWALEVLQSGLREPKEAKVSQLRAIQYLSAEDHGNHFDVLRGLARKNRSQKVRQEAIRGLASDPQSRDLLLEILQNRRESPAIRQAALLSLRIIDPDAYQQQAASIIEDEGESESLRAAYITTMRLEGHSADSSYSQAVQKVQNESSSKLLQKAAKLYLPPEAMER